MCIFNEERLSNHPRYSRRIIKQVSTGGSFKNVMVYGVPELSNLSVSQNTTFF